MRQRTSQGKRNEAERDGEEKGLKKGNKMKKKNK